jgi:hypothetical protein
VLYDATSGRLLSVITAPSGSRLLNVEFLLEGDLFTLTAGPGGQRFTLLDRNGDSVPMSRQAVFPAGRELIACGEPAPGVLAVARDDGAPRREGVPGQSEVYLVTLRQGTVRRVARGLTPSPSFSLANRVVPGGVILRTPGGWSWIDPGGRPETPAD